MKPKAYSYIRMSTDVQLKGDSLRRQTEASRKYAEENNLELVEDFRLEDIGVSAYDGRNIAQGSLGRFLALAQHKKIPAGSYLIVESLDRISRQNPQAATTLFLQILQAGINIVTLTDNHVYRSGSADFTDIIVSVVIMSRAYEESRTKSIRVAAAWENKRKNALDKKLTRVCPAWLKLKDDRSAFELIPAHVAVVRSIFSEAATGKGSFQIARKLNQDHVPTFAPASGWHESVVTKILTNRAVLGEYQPHRWIDGSRQPTGDPIKDYYPTIISNELFETVQAGRQARKNRGSGRKGRNNINLFSQVATCGYCGGGMRIVDKGAKPKGGIYLRCEHARRNADCDASTWPLDHFEAAFLRFVKELDLSSLIAERTDEHDQREKIEGEIAIVQAELSKKQRQRNQAFEMLSDEGVETSYVRTKLVELTTDIQALERKLEELNDTLSNNSKMQPADKSDIDALVDSLARGPKENADDRIKVADWIRRNVEALRVFPDGLDGPRKRLEAMQDALPVEVGSLAKKVSAYASRKQALIDGGRRRFEVSFGGSRYRAVEVDDVDPTKFSLSIYIDADIAATEALNRDDVQPLTLRLR